MRPEDRARFPAVAARLKDGREVTLRLLEPGDAEALTEFFATVPRRDFRFYCPHALTAPEARRTASRADVENHVCVVCVAEEGKVAGYAWYEWAAPDAPTSGFGILIRQTYQERGLGRAVMGRVLEIAAQVGPPLMALTVQMANTRAVALYRSMGFEVVREQERLASFGFETEPEFYMERQVR